MLLQTGCPSGLVEVLLHFADKYRSSMTSDLVQKNRKLGTRALIRIASRLARFSEYADLHTLLSHAVLAEFLPATERMNLDLVFEELKIEKTTPPVRPFPFNVSPLPDYNTIKYHAPPVLHDDTLEFAPPSSATSSPPSSDPITPVHIPRFDPKDDPEGAASHVPHMNHFYDNSLQTGLMRDLAIDMEVLGEHLVLLGNQVCFLLPVN